MRNINKIVIFICVCLLFIDGCNTNTKTPSSMNVTDTATIAVETVTPKIAQPPVSPQLLPINNAAEVWENGSWVIKNKSGEVTASWNAETHGWEYNEKTLQVEFEGAANPGTAIGLEGRINIPFSIPESWKIPVDKDQIDPNPLVPSGIINKFQVYEDPDAKTGLYEWVEIGVDFRGIVLAEPIGTQLPDGQKTKKFNVYVAGFSIINPDYPDKLYLITIPIYDSTDGSTYFDLNPNSPLKGNLDAVRSDKNDPNLYIVMNPLETIKVLQDPSVIGRRMLIQINVPIDGQTYKDSFWISKQNREFVEGIKAGIPISNIETTTTIGHLRLPRDLNIHLQNNN